MKSRLISTAVITVAWMALDFLFHGVLLMGAYTATAELWRPMEEMNTVVMNVVTVVTALLFVLIYCQTVNPKTMGRAIKIGVLIGLLVGVPMGFGTWSYMPIPMNMAIIWCLSAVVKYTVAGAVVGFFVKKNLDEA